MRKRRQHKEHQWYCTGCRRKKPFAGFDLAKRLCAECQDERPTAEAFLSAVAAHYSRLPPYLVSKVMRACRTAQRAS
jgi:hypothetical protein